MIPQTEPHARALRAHIAAAGIQVGLGQAPEGATAPYVVLYPDPGMMQGSLGDPNESLLVTFQVTAVGEGAEQALWAHDKARAALLSAPPTVAGRSLHPLWVLDAQPARRDDQVQPPMYVATAQYAMRSDPA